VPARLVDNLVKPGLVRLEICNVSRRRQARYGSAVARSRSAASAMTA
jgi:hypothetical protein